MNELFFILQVVVAIGIFYVIPIVIIYFIYKLAKKKLNSIIANAILTILTILFLIVSYADFYPLENSHTRIFKEKTGLPFPKPAKYLEKIAASSIFDFDGQMYCSKIRTTTESYLKLQKEIENSKFIMGNSYTELGDTQEIFSKIKKSDIDQTYRLQTSSEEYYVLFLSDKKTLILVYKRWFKTTKYDN